MPGFPAKTLPVLGAALLLAACNTTTDRLVDNRPPAVRALASVPPPPETTGSIGTARKDPEPEKPGIAAKPAPSIDAPVAKRTILPGDEEEGPALEAVAPPLPASPAEAIAEGRAAYRAGQFKDAERHFRGATQIDPKSAEAWLGVAASADRLRNFKVADKAYGKARDISGTTSEVLNNQGYSYLLRGDLKKARETLSAARKLDPANRYVENNLALLEASERKDKR